ncbi:hypothetical protein BDQ17DRAFT_1374820 [Cyathus striatus]|nr:hypothetical protein BDQ17DRAFT_1374820 [Cyathus striatus]
MHQFLQFIHVASIFLDTSFALVFILSFHHHSRLFIVCFNIIVNVVKLPPPVRFLYLCHFPHPPEFLLLFR